MEYEKKRGQDSVKRSRPKGSKRTVVRFARLREKT
jgi:hypothetical protein